MTGKDSGNRVRKYSVRRANLPRFKSQYVASMM